MSTATASASGPADAAGSAPRATGQLAEKRDDRIELRIPDTSYRLHLVTDAPVDGELGDRVTGVIRCQAKRVDVVPAGGRFIEPVYGRPRRIQGRVVGGDVQGNALYIQCGAPVVAQLMPPQQAADFKVGQMVCFDVERGATFEPAK